MIYVFGRWKCACGGCTRTCFNREQHVSQGSPRETFICLIKAFHVPGMNLLGCLMAVSALLTSPPDSAVLGNVGSQQSRLGPTGVLAAGEDRTQTHLLPPSVTHTHTPPLPSWYLPVYPFITPPPVFFLSFHSSLYILVQLFICLQTDHQLAPSLLLIGFFLPQSWLYWEMENGVSVCAPGHTRTLPWRQVCVCVCICENRFVCGCVCVWAGVFCMIDCVRVSEMVCMMCVYDPSASVWVDVNLFWSTPLPLCCSPIQLRVTSHNTALSVSCCYSAVSLPSSLCPPLFFILPLFLSPSLSLSLSLFSFSVSLSLFLSLYFSLSLSLQPRVNEWTQATYFIQGLSVLLTREDWWSNQIWTH